MSARTRNPPNRIAAAALLAAGLFGLGVVVATLTALVRCEQTSNEIGKAAAANTRAFQELLAAQRSELNEEPQWVDKKAGVLSIPIDRAMTLVLDEIRRDAEAATMPSAASSAALSPPAVASTPDAG